MITALARLAAHAGTLVAAGLGFALAGWAGAVAGALAGAVVDHLMHVERHLGWAWRGCGLVRGDQIFYSALFATMGHLAKADGRVSSAEVQAAEAVMAELGLSRERRRRAIRLFTAGKRRSFPSSRLLRKARRVAARERRERMLNFLLRIAYAESQVSAAEERVLVRAARDLGLPRTRLEDLMRRRRRQQRQASRTRSVRLSLSAAYDVLGVGETATETQIKRAYRRAISRHHPDRVLADGLPEPEVQAAARRTQQIRAAYDEIRRVRGF